MKPDFIQRQDAEEALLTRIDANRLRREALDTLGQCHHMTILAQELYAKANRIYALCDAKLLDPES
jgi:hypothetical protein